ncbi:MAG: thioester dehydrase [Proteobacteria bacterium]|nr:hypothetical protein [Cystobacterineae bacterium]MCL2313969.1 thioester dehydrase [Pseudomonadota bacterium]
MREEALQALLPHRGRMLLLSRVVAWNLEEGLLSAEYEVARGGLFFDEVLGGMPAWAGFELMAQSTSALSGLRRRAAGESPLFGFILSVSELVLHVPLLRGTVHIEVAEDTVVDNVFVFRCSLFAEGKVAVVAKLTIMETADFSVVRDK